MRRRTKNEGLFPQIFRRLLTSLASPSLFLPLLLISVFLSLLSFFLLLFPFIFFSLPVFVIFNFIIIFFFVLLPLPLILVSLIVFIASSSFWLYSFSSPLVSFKVLAYLSRLSHSFTITLPSFSLLLIRHLLPSPSFISLSSSNLSLFLLSLSLILLFFSPFLLFLLLILFFSLFLFSTPSFFPFTLGADIRAQMTQEVRILQESLA